MRVAYVCADPGVPVFGRKGASVHVQEVVRALLRRGARVTLFASRTGGEVPAGLEGVEVRRLPRPKSIDGRALPAADRERALQAADAQLPAALAAAGPFDLVYERYALWSTGALRHARATGTPSVLEVNAPLVDEQAEHRELIDAAGALRATQVAFAEADAVVAVSRPVADWARALGAPAARVHVVPNGVDPDRFPPRAAAGRRTTDPFTVGFVGTLKPWHGTEVLVDAVAAWARTSGSSWSGTAPSARGSSPARPPPGSATAWWPPGPSTPRTCPATSLGWTSPSRRTRRATPTSRRSRCSSTWPQACHCREPRRPGARAAARRRARGAGDARRRRRAGRRPRDAAP